MRIEALRAFCADHLGETVLPSAYRYLRNVQDGEAGGEGEDTDLVLRRMLGEERMPFANHIHKIMILEDVLYRK